MTGYSILPVTTSQESGSWRTAAVNELDCQSGLGWDAQSTHVRGPIAQLFSSLALPLGPAVEPA